MVSTEAEAASTAGDVKFSDAMSWRFVRWRSSSRPSMACSSGSPASAPGRKALAWPAWSDLTGKLIADESNDLVRGVPTHHPHVGQRHVGDLVRRAGPLPAGTQGPDRASETTVDGSPSQRPPSSTRRTLGSEVLADLGRRCASGGSPWRFALVTASGPVLRSSSRTTELRGQRSPIVAGSPPSSKATPGRRRSTMVSGPGQ